MQAMTTSGVVHLAVLEAEGFERKSTWLAMRRGLLSLFVHAPIRAIERLIASSIEKAADDLARRAVLFRGLRGQLADEVVPDGQYVELQSDALPLLEKLERDLLDLRAGTMQLQKSRGSATAPTAVALGQMSRAAAGFYEEVRNFRGALLAFEANYTERVGGMQACDDAELEELFKKLPLDA